MMDKNTYKVFQYIMDHPKQDLHLNVTSNMCPPDKKLKEKYYNMAQNICMEQKVEHMMQFVSLDAYGKKAEYIRDGLDFNYMMDNVEEFLDRIPVRNSITFICTYNNLSITSMDKLLAKILELRSKYSKTSRFKRCNEISHTGAKMRTQVRKIKRTFTLSLTNTIADVSQGSLTPSLRWKNFGRNVDTHEQSINQRVH